MELTTILAICAFSIAILLMMLQPTFRIGKRKLQIDYGFASLIGVVFLLLSGTLEWQNIITTLLGSATLKPYEILLIFMSLAYVCISLDSTGLFKYISLKIAQKAGTNGYMLFTLFFLLSSVLTIFTSHDIVILTLTPIILHFSKYTKANPVPLLIAQFFAANIWSMALYIGNPTNIIVAQAYQLGFLEYSKWMLFPTLAAGIASYILLFQVFRSQITKKIHLPMVSADSVLTDRSGAVFGVVCFTFCLIGLSLATELRISLGMITLATALVMLARDSQIKNLHDEKQYSRVVRVVKRMPWKIAPFILGMFVLVYQLVETGWVTMAAESISSITTNVAVLTIGIGFLSAFASNVMNNQPMTLLVTQIIQDPHFVSNALLQKGVMFAVIIGSNLGANITLIGTLAGIMWYSLLKESEIEISFRTFLKYGLMITPILILISCGILVLELMAFG